MITGSLIHSYNKFADVYGYIAIIYLIIAEISLTRYLKNMIRDSLENYYKNKRAHLDKRGSLLQGDLERDADEAHRNHQGDSSMNKFLIRIKEKGGYHGDTSPLGERRRTSINTYEESVTITYMRIEQVNEFELDEGFLSPAKKLERKGSIKEGEQSREQKELMEVEKSDNQSQDQIEKSIKIGKLLYYFQNRDNYLNCKMFYGGIFLMFRMTFFILISISDSIDCLISLISLIYLCYYWYTSIDNPTSSVRSLNKLAVIIVSIKYLIGCLDIQRSNYSGDTVDFESSVVLIFLGTTGNKNYDYFNILVGKSLSGYWLIFECLIFIAIQLLIYFYTVILQLNTVVISNHIKKVQYMISQYINYHRSVLTRRPFYVNFNQWYSPTVKFAENFLKIGTIYLPILSIMILLGFSQFYATLPIVIIVTLCLGVIYQLIFKWLYTILDQKDVIIKYFNWIKTLIWIYILLGSVSRIFAKPIKEFLPSYHPLGNITLVIVICLISFQIIIDLWGSVDFKRFYKEFLSSNRLSQVIVPMCEAYEFNESKLKKMISNLKSKESLDKRIKIMEKQLKIWHLKFASKDDTTGNFKDEKIDVEAWEKEISDLDKGEENLILELRNEEYLLNQVGVGEKLLNYFFLTFLNQLKRFNFCPHLYLMNYIKMKNNEICKDIEFKIYDYISEEYDEYLDISNAILTFYKSKDSVRGKLIEIKEENQKINQIAKQKELEQSEEPIRNKDESTLKIAADLLFKKVLKPRSLTSLDMTVKKKSDKTLLFFDAKVNEVTVRFYNITDMGSTDLKIIHRLSNLRKVVYVLYLFPSFILANFQGITLTVILAYCLTNPYPLKLVLLIHIIINGITEELNLNREFWKKSFIIISAISWLKIFIKAIFQIQVAGAEIRTYSIFESTEKSNAIIEFFFGNLSYEFLEVASFLFTILRILQAQFDGSFDRFVAEYENISQAYIRVGFCDLS